MQNPTKGKASSPCFSPIEGADNGHEIAQLVEEVLGVLRRHDADPNEGVLSLLTALIQAANHVLDASAPEDVEHNRAALLAMLEHGRRFVDTWPQQTPHGWSVH
jgi:hypothetical protein